MSAARETELTASRLPISPNDAEANLVSKVLPTHPAAARTHIQGIVSFTATIGPGGKVTDFTLIRGNPAVVEAAKGAVLPWVYHPATQDGQPVSFTTQILVSFTLSN